MYIFLSVQNLDISSNDTGFLWSFPIYILTEQYVHCTEGTVRLKCRRFTEVIIPNNIAFHAKIYLKINMLNLSN